MYDVHVVDSELAVGALAASLTSLRSTRTLLQRLIHRNDQSPSCLHTMNSFFEPTVTIPRHDQQQPLPLSLPVVVFDGVAVDFCTPPPRHTVEATDF